MPQSKGKIIVSGILMWFPLAGVTWQFLHYLIGLRRLGYDPYYVEDSSRWVYDPRLRELSPDPTANLATVVPALEAHGFGDRWAFRCPAPAEAHPTSNVSHRCYGLTESALNQLYREADAFINICGAQDVRDEHRPIKRRIYLETDPVATQIRVAQGDPATIAMLDAHDTHFSFGENFYHPDCKVPLSKYRWQPTRQPIILDLWNNTRPPGDTYSTIAAWRNAAKDIIYNGETYHWSKDREFQKFINLPSQRKINLGLALESDPGVRQFIEAHGWKWFDGAQISRTAESYRDFIQNSRGEFTVAKDQNIRLRSGWFSDRSACYLAAGRPVITQETGFSNILTTGKGLFGFSTSEEILCALDRIESDYPAASRAAQEIASEYFAAEKVLSKLMHEARL